MITFNYETDFKILNEKALENWIVTIIENHNCEAGEINYIFCDDAYLHKLNVEFLQHDTLTDIISFDNSLGKLINGDIFISVERVADNANDFKVSFEDELHRVMIHGILHYIGFKDKTEPERKEMRNQENNALLNLIN
ncbi:rRNA maturation RNase YbeY [Polaribacter aestuariivivens]|uniref:Endoribonuclease YbeY n=1 Tax=Polaribacter aestuariivivens TaxID=2304626 RepID=A0A5S3N6B1_9FLAO|nr:rRNA maturation RNase YbeY [Polaribacter aestuariivivens]TMM30372.1 rRNA maturation RNase YbeY [Polaribacter aestuariivivens]